MSNSVDEFLSLMKDCDLKLVNPILGYKTPETRLDYIKNLLNGFNITRFHCFSLEKLELLCVVYQIPKQMVWDDRSFYIEFKINNVKKVNIGYSPLILNNKNVDIFLHWVDDELEYGSQFSEVEWYEFQRFSYPENNKFKKLVVMKNFHHRQTLTSDRLVHISMPLYSIGYEDARCELVSKRKDHLLIKDFLDQKPLVKALKNLKMEYHNIDPGQFYCVHGVAPNASNFQWGSYVNGAIIHTTTEGDKLRYEKKEGAVFEITFVPNPKSAMGKKLARKYKSGNKALTMTSVFGSIDLVPTKFTINME